jgi:hypothetical protein
MKKSLLIISVVVSVSLLNVGQVYAMDKNMEKKLVKVCEALKSDSRIRLQQAISNVSAGYKQIAEGLVCNGMDPITFALSNGAEKTAKLLANRSNKDYNEMLAKL